MWFGSSAGYFASNLQLAAVIEWCLVSIFFSIVKGTVSSVNFIYANCVSLSLVPPPIPAFQCCMLKSGRAWESKSRDILCMGGPVISNLTFENGYLEFSLSASRLSGGRLLEKVSVLYRICKLLKLVRMTLHVTLTPSHINFYCINFYCTTNVHKVMHENARTHKFWRPVLTNLHNLFVYI